MSIQSEIERLSSAKQDLVDWLLDHDVEVSFNAKLDELVSLLADVSTDSGEEKDFVHVEVKHGSNTLISKTVTPPGSSASGTLVLQGAGYEVVGVSKDSAASHVKFKEKHSLPFPLIADVDKTLLEAMGAWGEKTMYGKKTMGTIRTTFVINEEGIVEQIFSGKQVKTKEHAEQILAL